VLDQKIKDMKDLQRLENIRANREQQEATDAKYRILVTKTHQLVSVIEYLRKDAEIEQEENTKNNILAHLEELKMAFESGLVDKDKIASSETKLMTIQVECKKNWVKQYALLTSARVSTLKAILGIDPQKVSSCLRDIQKAETWNTDIVVFKTMMSALKSADQLITNLGLNQEIIIFLQNMNQGRATLADLTDEVLNWVKEENLESKIGLSFRTENRM
jgi:hypothetical protein